MSTKDTSYLATSQERNANLFYAHIKNNTRRVSEVAIQSPY